MFRDRMAAGRELAEKLRAYRERNPLVLGLPRGGVPVAAQVAQALHAPLDVLVARKLGAPGNPEFAIGAVTARGTRVLYQDVLRHALLPPGYLDHETQAQHALALERETRLRSDRPAVPRAGKTVILVDDGLATGMTMAAAVADVRAEHPAAIVVAAPVMPPETYRTLAAQVDAVVALDLPENFQAVGQFYEDFSQTTDEEVKTLLSASLRSTLERP